jgi:hypothetical protein
VGDRLIHGRVEEREKAFEVYDDAMAAGHSAFLLDQERPNIFTVSVGNLRPQQTIEIAITYVTLLTFEGAAIRLLIPTTVSPRYVPAGPPEVGQPDGERVNPPAQETVPYGLTLSLEIRDTTMVQIESPSHAICTTPHAHGTTVTPASDFVASATWRGATGRRYAAARRRSVRPTARAPNSSSWDSAMVCCRAPRAMLPSRSAVRRTRPPRRLSCGKSPLPSRRAGMAGAACYRRWPR